MLPIVMKKFPIITLLWSLIASILLVACAKEQSPKKGNADQEVHFSSNIEIASLRVQNNQFETNDAIGIYMLKSGEAFERALQPLNAKYIVQAEGNIAHFKPADAANTLKYNSQISQADFIAYYPYTTPSDGKVTINTANQSNLAAIDLLYSNNLKQQKKSEQPLALHFKHKLPILIFEFKDKDGTAIPAESISNLSIKKILTEVEMNLSNGTLSTKGNASDIAVHASGQAIVAPQEIANMEVSFTYASKSYTWKIGKKNIEEGKKYRFSAKVLEEGVTPIDNGSGSIDDREDGDNTEGVDLTPETITLELQNGPIAPVEAKAQNNIEILLNSNAETFSVQVTEGAAWLSAKAEASSKKILFSVTENTAKEARTGKLLVSATATTSALFRTGEEKTLEITITQVAASGKEDPTSEGSLLIGAIAEGKSFEKYLIIENRSNETIDLDGGHYAVNLYPFSSKGKLGATKTLALTGTLEPGKAIAIMNTQASQQELRKNVVRNIQDNTIANFNGDDPITITMGEEKVVDCFLPTPTGNNDIAPTKADYEDRLFIRNKEIKNGTQTFKIEEWKEVPAKVNDMGQIAEFVELFL